MYYKLINSSELLQVLVTRFLNGLQNINVAAIVRIVLVTYPESERSKDFLNIKLLVSRVLCD